MSRPQRHRGFFFVSNQIYLVWCLIFSVFLACVSAKGSKNCIRITTRIVPIRLKNDCLISYLKRAFERSIYYLGFAVDTDATLHSLPLDLALKLSLGRNPAPRMRLILKSTKGDYSSRSHTSCPPGAKSS